MQSMQFAVYISDTPVTLKQSQGHQTYNHNVEPKKCYNHATIKYPALIVSKKRANVKVVFFTQEIK